MAENRDGFAVLRGDGKPASYAPCVASNDRVPKTCQVGEETRPVWKWTTNEATAMRLAARFAKSADDGKAAKRAKDRLDRTRSKIAAAMAPKGVK